MSNMILTSRNAFVPTGTDDKAEVAPREFEKQEAERRLLEDEQNFVGPVKDRRHFEVAEAGPLGGKADPSEVQGTRETKTPEVEKASNREARRPPQSWPPVLKTFHALFELACGRDLPRSEGADARHMQLVIVGLLSSLSLAAIWGAAAGSADTSLVLANLVKVPLVVLLSVVATLPASMLALRLSNVGLRSVDLLVAVSAGTFSGTLALGVLSPLVAVYYQTSAYAGPMLAIGSVLTALVVGSAIFIRGVVARREPGTKKSHMIVPIVVQLGMLALILVQLIALASPIIPELTIFDAGVDGVLR